MAGTQERTVRGPGLRAGLISAGEEGHLSQASLWVTLGGQRLPPPRPGEVASQGKGTSPRPMPRDDCPGTPRQRAEGSGSERVESGMNKQLHGNKRGQGGWVKEQMGRWAGGQVDR